MGITVEHASVVVLFWQQLKIMVYKQYLLAKRGWKVSILRLLIPSFFLLLFAIIVKAALAPPTGGQHPPASDPIYLPKCFVATGSCTTLLYSPSTPAVAKIMAFVAQANPHLTIGVDIVATNMGVEGLKNYLWNIAPNTTQGAVFFDNGGEGDAFSYMILYNGSYSYKQLNDMDFSYSSHQYTNFRYHMQVAIETAIVQSTMEYNDGASITVRSKPYPTLVAPVDEFTKMLVQNVGQALFYMGLTITLIVGLNSLATEKDRKIRGYLKSFGLLEGVHWVSWFLELFFFYEISMLLFLALGYILNFLEFFANSNFWALFFIFTAYGIMLISFCFLLSVFVITPRGANIMGGALYTLGLGFPMTFSFLGSIMYLLWDPTNKAKVYIWRYLFAPFPFWQFTKCMVDVSTVSIGNIFDPRGDSSSDSASNFEWDNMYTRPNGYTPSTAATVGYMLIFSVIYLVLAWYIEYVVASGGGAKRPLWFFVLPQFWGFAQPLPYTRSVDSPYVSNNQINKGDPDLINEKIDNNTEDKQAALRIVGLFKYFKSVEAVSNLYMKAKAGQLLAVLGHNGAGKTTTINILTGLTSASFGDAFIFGYSVKYDMDTIRKLLGCCPQFDVYWPELTAREHLWILGHLKNISGNKAAARSEVEEKLKNVRLSKVGDQHVSTFSGGMRRRLSMALSTIGNPPVIILDEPTTGIDPANRRYIWRMIEKLKKDKLVILTTHSMEEADALGDKIVIMSKGQLKCVGSSLHLKAKYGAGYRVHVVVEEPKVVEVKQRVSALVPGVHVVAENAGSLVFGLPEQYDEASFSALFSYFKQPENKIKDWGLSNTTLEDVFLKVTREDYHF